MLVARFEVWPDGDESRRKDLGQVHIHAVGGGEARRHYAALLYAEGVNGRVVDTAEIPDWPRQRLGPWPLLARALDLLVGWRWRCDGWAAPKSKWVRTGD